MNEEPVTISLGRAEALILFELLADFYKGASVPVADNAERLALVRLDGALQKTLVEPFSPNYKNLIENARSRLVEEVGNV